MKLLRIYFEKRGEAAYISHLDLQRVFARSLRRSGLPVWYSQGFNPHIYMSFALPLPLLQESACEMVDCKTESEQEDFSHYIAPLNAALPRGLQVSAIEVGGAPVAQIAFADYTITYPDAKALATACAAYNEAGEVLVVRKTKRTQQEVDLKEYIQELAVGDDGSIHVRLPAGGTLNYNPELLLRALEELAQLPAVDAGVLRTGVLQADGEPFV